MEIICDGGQSYDNHVKKKRGRKPKNKDEKKVTKKISTKKEDQTEITKKSKKEITIKNDYILQLKMNKDDIPNNITEVKKPLSEEDYVKYIERRNILKDINYEVNKPNIEDNFMIYNPNINDPNAIDELGGYVGSNFSSLPLEIEGNKSALDADADIEIDSYLNSLNDENINEIVSNNAIILCKNDCHPIDIDLETGKKVTFEMPIKYYNGKFYTDGNGKFCSLECMATYNFSNKSYNIQDIWEVYNLINLMGLKLGYTEPVRLAPDTDCLTDLNPNGTMTIKQYREYNNNTNKIMNKLVYPLVSKNSAMSETNHASYNKNSNNYNSRKMKKIKIDDEKLRRIEEEEIIKTKLDMKNNPLFKSMNISLIEEK